MARFRLLTLMTVASLSLLGSCSTTPAFDESVESVERPADDPPGTVELALTLDRQDPRRSAAIAQLRADGPAGLDALIAEYRRVPERSASEDASWRALIDEVAQQRDAVYGGIFWYTDMREAQAAAASSGKPILSLRMLGELTSEYSCANSRLFRTLLYADPELADWLERSFVLHWSSERPVPRLEIDFGDGRRVTRTITGNSAHFVLDAEGRTIDVIPGLLTRLEFRSSLMSSLELHRALASISGERRWRAALAEHHERMFEVEAVALSEAIGQLRGTPAPYEATRAWLRASPNPGGERVAARRAVPMAASKSRIEMPVLDRATDQLGGPAGRLAAAAPTPDELALLGVVYVGEFALHPNSEAIIASERPLDGLVAADRRAAAELAMRTALLESLRVDTVKNMFEMHTRVRLELARRAREATSLGFAEVDAWLYAELFETPASDPWLGLVDPTVYTGLAGGGLVGAPGE